MSYSARFTIGFFSICATIILFCLLSGSVLSQNVTSLVAAISAQISDVRRPLRRHIPIIFVMSIDISATVSTDTAFDIDRDEFKAASTAKVLLTPVWSQISCSEGMEAAALPPEVSMTETAASNTDLEKEICEEEKKGAIVAPYGPLSLLEYTNSFQLGDIADVWFDSITREATAFRGSWQVLLNRSDPVDELMKALGISMLKRRVMASYSSITDMELIKDDAKSPVIKITTHLPLNNLKQSVVAFDNTWAEQKDSDTGTWRTWSVWINGRAIQRREGPLGTMFDVRAIFPSDPLSTESKIESQGVSGPLMLFKWTFIPTGKPPITSMRWMKKL
ncbi:putative transmembrane protein [Toxoplasma gondii FOU]|uniref:Putative transmembrane protein n=1 Tax=Toxoplasma gondii FOU TaxID=943167 RepID=A0A086KFT8_TOXGO|nr:putative transmembrane protein [Toxoplasma gondii FOU]